MNIYHVFIDDTEGGFMIAVCLYSADQVRLVGESFPTISRIDTWDGNNIYERKTVH